jgi:hypothetical protein
MSAEITERLATVERLLALMFDAYEDGDPCYDNLPAEDGSYIGNAVRIDDAAFHEIADYLNRHCPRAAGAGSSHE